MGINLEDIKAPECLEVETSLKSLKKLPVFHDDQHGTAIVALGGLINALTFANKQAKDCKVVVNGAGAAGITIAQLFLAYGFKDIIVCDSKGAVFKDSGTGMNANKHAIAEVTNLDCRQGSL